MTSNAVTAGIKDVLNKFDDEQLFGLARTTTQGLLKGGIHTREDAIDVILKYSLNVVSILRRRAVTRDILFSYLHDKNIAVLLPTTKDKLIDQICSLWHIENHEGQSLSIESKCERTDDGSDVNTMAIQFSQWFYEMMNQDKLMDTSHFFPDAALSLTMIADRNTHTEDVYTPEEIVKVLYNTKTNHTLYFNPNLDADGVRGVLDAHGLVIILVCGTLHSSNLCMGVFEQMFSLARDPVCENNWKVKMMKMNLRSKSVSTQPTLQDSNFSSALVHIDRED